MATACYNSIQRKPVGSETSKNKRDFVPLTEYQARQVDAARKRVRDNDRQIELSVRIKQDLAARGFQFSEAQIDDALDGMIDCAARCVAVLRSAAEFGLQESTRMARDAFREREVA